MKTPVYQVSKLALLFPPLPAAELASLGESIQRSGLREAIVLHNGEILDGRNRYEACQAVKVAPHFREFGSLPTDGTSPAHFVADKNLHHRHLSVAQRAAVAEEMIPYFESEAMNKTEATAAAAAVAGVSTRSVQRAHAKKKEAAAAAAAAPDPKTEAGKRQAEQAKAEEKQMEEYRDKHAEALTKTHGEAFGHALKQGTILKTLAELEEFTKQPKEDQKMIAELVIQGWAVKRALKFMLAVLDGDNKLKDLALQAAGLGKPVKVLVNGYMITARKATAGEAV